jgi:hypothetical protein
MDSERRGLEKWRAPLNYLMAASGTSGPMCRTRTGTCRSYMPLKQLPPRGSPRAHVGALDAGLCLASRVNGHLASSMAAAFAISLILHICI